MSETLSDWDLFAAAWLAKTIVVPPPHGETPESYAAKQCETAAQVATRMLQLKAVHVAMSSNSPMQRAMSPQTAGVLQRLLGETIPAPGGAPPSHTALTGQPCWRAFNGKQRGQGEDCTGVYDDHGVCKVCRLAYTMPGDPPKPSFTPSYGPPPLPPPSGAPVQIGQVTPRMDGSVPPPAFPVIPPSAS